MEITVDSGAAKSTRPIRKKGVARTKSTKTVRLAATSGVEGDAKLEFIRHGKMCNMTSLDADFERPLASVSAIVDGGTIVVFGPQGSYIENSSTGQDSDE